MKSTSTTNLRGVELVGTTATAPRTTGAAYIEALRAVAVGKKHPVSVRVFWRWVDSRYGLDKQFDMNEEVLGRFRDEMQTGQFRSETGRKYRSLGRQAPSSIFRLHNQAARRRGPVTRPLLDSHRYGRLRTLAGLTPQTQRALRWFHESGTRTLKNGRQQLMTQATRDKSLAAALSVLERMGVNGLELVKPRHVDQMLPPPDPADRMFRRLTRLLYATSVVYRSCVKKGLLHDNPLNDIDSSIFAAYAKRDFLPPGEVGRLRGLSTVDRSNADRVRDRLVMLLLVDTAMRKSELAAVQLGDVRELDDGSYQIRLDSDAQKMTGKPAAYIGILYPETQELLSLYLREVRGTGGTSLLVDGRGNDATPEGIYRAAIREGDRLQLRCYHSGKRPGCHDLRRTFATINAAPLGLQLTTAELAERMRTSFDIVHQHYVVQNPLRASASEEAYRRRLSTDPVRQCQNHIEALEALGIDESVLGPVRQQVEAMRTPLEADLGVDRERDWIPEAEALELLARTWSTQPKVRTFRDFMKMQDATCRRGNHGGLHIDGTVVKDLVDTHIPAADLVKMSGGESDIPTEYVALSIGRLRLVKRIDVAVLMKALRHRAHAKTSPRKVGTYLKEVA